MMVGSSPLLTRGTLALFYGGQSIIDQLSKDSPGREQIFATTDALVVITVYSTPLRIFAPNLRKAVLDVFFFGLYKFSRQNG